MRTLAFSLLLLSAACANAQTLDSVLTTDTPNQGRAKWNANDFKLRDSITAHRTNLTTLFTNRVSGSGTLNRVACWSATSTLAALQSLAWTDSSLLFTPASRGRAYLYLTGHDAAYDTYVMGDSTGRLYLYDGFAGLRSLSSLAGGQQYADTLTYDATIYYVNKEVQGAKDSLAGQSINPTGLAAGHGLVFDGSEWIPATHIPVTLSANRLTQSNGTADTLYESLYQVDDRTDTVATRDYARAQDAVTLDAAVHDVAFGSGWNGDTTAAPSKNAVYDRVNTLRTSSVTFTVLDTVKTGGETVWAWKVPHAITITEIAAFTDANTVTFNIEQRGETTPNTAGTDCMSADLVADSNQEESVASADATVPAYTWLVCVVSAAGDVSMFSCTITYTID